MARAVGAPVIHSAHSGPVECRLPLTPITYRGWFQGGAVICDEHGTVLARRGRAEGPGIVVADLTPARAQPTAPIPDRYWLHNRGAIPATLPLIS